MVGGTVLLLLGVFFIGYAMMWELLGHMPWDRIPQAAIGGIDRHLLSAIAGPVLALAGILLLFVAKWYAGVLGLVGGWVGVQLSLRGNLALFAALGKYSKYAYRRRDESFEEFTLPWFARFLRWLLQFGSIRVVCPECGAELCTSKRNLGLIGMCPECGLPFASGDRSKRDDSQEEG